MIFECDLKFSDDDSDCYTPDSGLKDMPLHTWGLPIT